MKALIQRVKNANVKVDGRIKGKTENGMVVFLGVGKEDNENDIEYLVNKIINLRIFPGESKPLDKSLPEIDGGLLIISQFTLYASTKKGRRPDFTDAADPEKANKLYEKFVQKCIEMNIKTETGVFGAMMEVELINDGPVTLLIDSMDK